MIVSNRTTRVLLRLERRVSEVDQHKSTLSHSFPKSNCSQEASGTRLSAYFSREHGNLSGMVVLNRYLSGVSQSKKNSVYLRVGEVERKKETVAVGVDYCLPAQALATQYESTAR